MNKLIRDLEVDNVEHPSLCMGLAGITNSQPFGPYAAGTLRLTGCHVKPKDSWPGTAVVRLRFEHDALGWPDLPERPFRMDFSPFFGYQTVDGVLKLELEGPLGADDRRPPCFLEFGAIRLLPETNDEEQDDAESGAV